MGKEVIPIGAEPSSERLDPRPRKWWHFGGKDTAFVSVDAGYETRSEASSTEDLVKNVDNVFVAPEAMELYKPIEGFEGTHRFDPSATWSAEEEKKLVRRVSIAFLCSMAFANIKSSSTGELRCRPASCSLLCSSIEATSHKLCLTTCCVSLATIVQPYS